MIYLSQIIILGLLFIAAALFAGSETSLFSLKKGTLHRYHHSDKKSERLISLVMQKPERILVTILTGNLLVHILLSQFSTKLFLSFFAHYGHIVAIFVITPLLIIFGEITPKIIALGNAEYFSRKLVYPIYMLNKLFIPIRLLFSGISKPFFKVFKLQAHEEKSITSDDIEMEIDHKEASGLLTSEEADFIRNVVFFSEKKAWNIMIPRNQAVFIPESASVQEALAIFKETGVVRAPVFSGSPDTVVGMVDSRELIFHSQGIKKDCAVKKYIQPIPFFPASIAVDNLLNSFLSTKLQIAVAVDEFGGTAGIVTLSSIISELMGRGFTLSNEEEKKEIRELDKDCFIVSGDIQLDDFNSFFDEELIAEENDTLAGYIIEYLGHFPTRNAVLFTPKRKIRIRSVRKNRIESVEITLRPESES